MQASCLGCNTPLELKTPLTTFVLYTSERYVECFCPKDNRRFSVKEEKACSPKLST